jgi:hypothetical protein
MSYYRILRFHEDTRSISEHLNVEAHDALAAAQLICPDPLVAFGPPERFRAYVTRMDNPCQFVLFYSPPGSIGTFGRRLGQSRFHAGAGLIGAGARHDAAPPAASLTVWSRVWRLMAGLSPRPSVPPADQEIRSRPTPHGFRREKDSA